MAAIALTTLKQFSIQHLVPMLIGVTTLTTLDWINLTGLKGVILPQSLQIACSTANNAPDVGTVQYGIALSTAAYATVTTTSIVVDGAGADATKTRAVPFYAKCKSGEIIEVTGDSAPEAATATWTIRRGCFGTTPTAIADNDYFCIMNQIVIASTRVGFATGMVFAMPNDPAVKLFT
jgi:hypothetical protein